MSNSSNQSTHSVLHNNTHQSIHNYYNNTSSQISHTRAGKYIHQLVMPSVDPSVPSSHTPASTTPTNQSSIQPYGVRQQPPTSSAKPKTDQPLLSAYPYILPSKVSFRDCDMYYHVNNATYYHYFDNLFNTFFVEEAGMDPAYGNIIGITAANECSYLSDISFPCRLRLALRVVHIGTTSCKIESAVYKSIHSNIKTGGFHSGDGKLDVSLAHSESCSDWVLAAIGTYTWVFCERVPGQKMKPVKIPDIMREALHRAYTKQSNDDHKKK